MDYAATVFLMMRNVTGWQQCCLACRCSSCRFLVLTAARQLGQELQDMDMVFQAARDRGLDGTWTSTDWFPAGGSQHEAVLLVEDWGRSALPTVGCKVLLQIA
eukprot:757822-Hanusia_phi.AAC.2